MGDDLRSVDAAFRAKAGALLEGCGLPTAMERRGRD